MQYVDPFYYGHHWDYTKCGGVLVFRDSARFNSFVGWGEGGRRAFAPTKTFSPSITSAVNIPK